LATEAFLFRQRTTTINLTGELNGSLSGSAHFTALLTIMEKVRFLPRISQAGRMVFEPI